MTQFERCGNESQFYLDTEVSTDRSLHFLSPLFAYVTAEAISRLEDEKEDPRYDGAVFVGSSHITLANLEDPDSILTKVYRPDDPESDPVVKWLRILAAAIKTYGPDPVVLTEEFESSFLYEEKEKILDNIGFIMNLGPNSPDRPWIEFTFVSEGSPAQNSLLESKARVEKAGKADMESRWAEAVKKRENRPFREREPLSIKEKNLRDDLRNYGLLPALQIVPDARKASEAFLFRIGAFECATKITWLP